MKERLLIVGAGQYGMVAKEIAEAMGIFSEIAFLDNEKSFAIGPFDAYRSFVGNYRYAVVALGNAKLRVQWIRNMEEAGYTIPVLVHPLAYVSPSAKLMKGTIVEPMVVVNTEAVVSTGCILSAGAVINHNSRIGEGAHVDCNATVAGSAVVLAGEKVHSNTVVESGLLGHHDINPSSR